MDCHPLQTCVNHPLLTLNVGIDTTACKNCTVGKFSTAIGADSVKTCNDCAPGKYNPDEGAKSSSNCNDCPEKLVSTQFGSIIALVIFFI